MICSDQNFEHTILEWLKNEEGSYVGTCEDDFVVLSNHGSSFEVVTVMSKLKIIVKRNYTSGSHSSDSVV
jgi:hypothetical protein